MPLVDWGVRFEDAIRVPARLSVDLRTVDRATVASVAQGGSLDIQRVRAEARDAIAGYLRKLSRLALTARGRSGCSWRSPSAIARDRGFATPSRPRSSRPPRSAVAFVVLVPPRGEMDEPQYYAFGPDIPRALEAVEAAQRSTRQLDQELDAQLVGLARLVAEPAGRTPLADRPRITIASDLHNNFLAAPILERATDNGPLLFAGDLTDRGSPLEARLVSRVAGSAPVRLRVRQPRLGLARARPRRARRGRADPARPAEGRRHVRRTDRRRRRAARGRLQRPVPAPLGRELPGPLRAVPSPAQQDAFTAWLNTIIGEVDVVMVHEPALIEPALAILEDEPPDHPLVFVTGHTHQAAIEHEAAVTVSTAARSAPAGPATWRSRPTTGSRG